MELTTNLKDLTKDALAKAITYKNKDELRDLLIASYEDATNKGVKVNGFYYDYYVALSTEVFDTFALRGLKSLFSLHGFDVDTIQEGVDENDLAIGKMIVKKDDFSFEMKWIETMHDSLITLFVDTKTAKIINR